jgi:uncharacterized protein (TIGR02996 family)
MSPEEQLLSEVLARPDDDAPRLAYAELMDAKGDPRGEFIRVQLELFRAEQLRQQPSNWLELVDRRDASLREHGARWAADVAPLVDKVEFQRGFVDAVTLPVTAYLERAAAIYAVAPVRVLTFTAAAGHCRELFASPHLGRIRAIVLWNQRIGDEGAEALAASPHVGEVRYLNLRANRITQKGLEALCASPGLAKLTYVDLGGNKFEDPCDQPGAVDNHRILDWVTPESQGELEARYGAKPWFHYTPLYDWHYPPAIESVI